MTREKYVGVIIAAGKGTRIAEHTGAGTNKCSLKVNGKELVRYPVEALLSNGIQDIVVVTRHASESVRNALNGSNVKFVDQGSQDGTAKAVEAAISNIHPDTFSTAVVLYGDSSLFITANVLKALLTQHESTSSDMTLLSVDVPNPTALGRIKRDSQGRLTGIVEEKDATESERALHEINTGAAVYSMEMLRHLLSEIPINEVKQEYYLTDIVKIGLQAGYLVTAYKSSDWRVGIGINSKEDHLRAEEEMQKHLKEELE